LIVEKSENVALITLNRPDQLNAVNREMLSELQQAFGELEKDNSVRTVVLTGAGEKAFSCGADLKGGLFSSDTSRSEARQLAKTGHAVCTKIENLGKPVIAAVNGLALGGGCEIAMSCDIVLAAEGARFGQPEINIGLIPGWGGTQRLPRLVGLNVAKEMVFTGKMIDAKEAQSMGLVNKTIPAQAFRSDVLKFAKQLSEKSPIMLRLAKRAINFSRKDLEEGLAEELTAFSNCFETEDYKEGITAFLTTRQPKFTGQ
jgi:enoyl-CoA hydratase